jgi:two-component system chemotaxis response regulator CheY
MSSMIPKRLESLVQSTRVLMVGDDYYMRKVVRGLLLTLGVSRIAEARNGAAGLDAICVIRPDLVILDWDMPGMNGRTFMRNVRSPETFAAPDVPIIMLTGDMAHERVIEAVRLGVNELLCKPVSAKSLLERIIAIRATPRPIVRMGNYYGPKPRNMAGDLAPAEPAPSDAPTPTNATDETARETVFL